MFHDGHDKATASLPTSTSSLLLPTASLNVSKTISSLSRSALSITNRLTSIHHDSHFVRHVADHYKLPVVANERCGSWYISPEIKAGSAYFKSTDGHHGQWTFSTRRLNLQVLDVVGKHGGCIIVDSTRRGKTMADALSKTVPIWCAVMNRLLFGDGETQDLGLYTPADLVSASEHSQMEARLDRFVEEAKRLELPLSSLRQHIFRPLRPVFVTPASPLPSFKPHPNHHPIICLTASSVLSSSSNSSKTYVQGAADDSESWSHGLTPSLFWAHEEQLLSTSEDDLPRLIHALLNRSFSAIRPLGNAPSPTLIHPTKSVHIAPLSSISPSFLSDWDAIIICAPTNPFTDLKKDTLLKDPEKALTIADVEKAPNPLILHLPCPVNRKRASRALRSELPRFAVAINPFLRTHKPLSRPLKVLCTCPTGTDLSVGAALVMLCEFADENGRLSWVSCGDDYVIDKTYIRRRLAWIMSSMPEANPSRETLQAVNICMMGYTKGHEYK